MAVTVIVAMVVVAVAATVAVAEEVMVVVVEEVMVAVVLVAGEGLAPAPPRTIAVADVPRTQRPHASVVCLLIE